MYDKYDTALSRGRSEQKDTGRKFNINQIRSIILLSGQCILDLGSFAHLDATYLQELIGLIEFLEPLDTRRISVVKIGCHKKYVSLMRKIHVLRASWELIRYLFVCLITFSCALLLLSLLSDRQVKIMNILTRFIDYDYKSIVAIIRAKHVLTLHLSTANWRCSLLAAAARTLMHVM